MFVQPVSAAEPVALPKAPARSVRVLGVAFIAAIFTLLIAGCGGGGGGTTSTPAASVPAPAPVAENGQLVISITDAPGDFDVYEVDVVELRLTRQNGDVISALPLATRIDFAELTEVTELLSIATVPAGVYTDVQVTLDFSNANVVVQDAAGQAALAAVLDAQGAPLGVAEVRLVLAESELVRIAPGRPAAFSLDFDLDASNTIDLSTSPPEVRVEPLLLATPELELNRAHRVRGLLQEVDPSANTVSLAVRPFRRVGDFGEFTLLVDDTTHYDINNEAYVGAAGLDALGLLPARTAVVAGGRIEQVDERRTFVAETIEAGDSVPGATGDTVSGVIVARLESSLTVRGARIDLADGSHSYPGEFVVSFDDTTSVSAPLGGGADIGTSHLSVGQRLIAWGEFHNEGELQATRIRLPQASLTGVVVSAAPLVVDLFLLSGRRPGAFDFSGTGVTPDSDADPENYELGSRVQPPGSLSVGELVRARGFVSEFGSAAPDFVARTVIDPVSDLGAATLHVGWNEPVIMPLLNAAADRIDVDLTSARKWLKLRGLRNDVVDPLSDVALIAPDSGNGVYAVTVRGSNEQAVYRSFGALVEALVEQLDNGNALRRITAQGGYNVNSGELVARRAGFVFSAQQTGG